MSNLTSTDQLKALRINEAIIEDGIDTFVGVGQALLEIRENKQYLIDGWSTFSDYCNGVWPDLPQATRYYEIDVAQIKNILSDEGIVPAHARAMKKVLKDDADLIRGTWVEVRTQLEPEEITADYVTRIAKKKWLEKNSGPLGEAVRLQKVTPEKAYELQKILGKLPDKYTLSVLKFGIGEDCVSGDTLRAIQALNYQSTEAADEILTSGYLYKIPLWQLTPQDIQRYQQRLLYEEAQGRILETMDKQKERLEPNVRIFDSVGSWVLEDEPLLYFMFSNGVIDNQELIDFINNHKLKMFLLAAYDPTNPPTINFDGTGVKPEQVRVKPKNLIDYINKATL